MQPRLAIPSEQSPLFEKGESSKPVHTPSSSEHTFGLDRSGQQCTQEKSESSWTLKTKLPAEGASLELTDEEIVNGVTKLMEFSNAVNIKDGETPSWENPISVFFSVTMPEIETKLYVKRLVKYAQCSKSAFVVALVYLRRLEEKDEVLAITAFNMHRLIITALMIAAKVLDDRCFSNAHYARVGGISTVQEINRLEIEMLQLLDHKLVVSSEEYAAEAHHIRDPSERTQPLLEMSDWNGEELKVPSSPPTKPHDEDEDMHLVSGDGQTYQFDAPRQDYQVLPLVREASRECSERFSILDEAPP